MLKRPEKRIIAVVLLSLTAVFLYAQSAKTSFEKGKRLFDQSNYDAAIQELDKAINLDPNFAEAYAYRSWAHGRQNNNDQSLTDSNEAIRLNPKLAMGYFARGRLQSNNDSAIADYTEAIKLDPKFAMAYNNRGRAYYNKNDYDHAMADFNQVVKKDSKYVDAYFMRGVLYHEKKDYDKAITEYTRALKLNPNHAIAYTNRGNIYENKKDYDRAVADFNEAIKVNPNYADAYNSRGVLYLDIKKDYDRALANFNEAIKINQKSIYPYYNRGRVYEEKKDYKSAQADYAEAMKLNPSHSGAKEGYERVSKVVNKEAKRLAQEEANKFNPSSFIIYPKDFKPAYYTKRDLFAVVAFVNQIPLGNLLRSRAVELAIDGENSWENISRLADVAGYEFSSDVVFVRQNGTDILFKTADNAISQDMKINTRSGLTPGQRVRVYYRVREMNFIREWHVMAIERL